MTSVQRIIKLKILTKTLIPLNGKEPVSKGWTSTNHDEEGYELVMRHINNSNGSNYGVICGKVSGIVVVDIDVKEEEGIMSGLKNGTN